MSEKTLGCAEFEKNYPFPVLTRLIVTVVDPHKNKKPKLDTTREIQGHFCAFGSNLKFILYWDPTSPRELKRSYHCIIEDTATFVAKLENKVFSITEGLKPEQLPPIPLEIQQTAVTERMFDVCDTGFPDKEIKSITITLPKHPSAIGLKLCDDTLYNLPFIKSTVRNSFASKHIPTTMRTNHFILAINSDSPLTKDFALNLINKI